MPIVNFNGTSASATSSWTAHGKADTGYELISGPTTGYGYPTVDYSTIPAGSTIHSATMAFTLSSAGGSWKLDGATMTSGMSVAVTPGGVHTYAFRYTSTYPGGASGSRTKTISNIVVTVNYTPPWTTPTMGNVTLAGSTSNRYTGASVNSVIAWSATNGNYNAISGYETQRSVNGGAWAALSFSSGGNVASNATAGGSHKYRVRALAPYSNSAWKESPTLYTYSKVTVPTNLALGKTTVYTGESVNLTWSASGAGTGVSVSLYRIQQGTSNLATTTSTNYSITAPATAGTYTYRVRAEGSVSGYDSNYTSNVTLTVLPRQSSYILNKSTVEINSTITATITPVDPTFKHELSFVLGGNTQGPYTVAAGNTTYTFTIPTATWGSQMSATTSATATCKMKTLNGSTQVGSIVDIPFTVTIPSSYIPTLPTPTVVSSGNPTGFTGAQLYIQGITQPKITANASGVIGSTISKYNFSISGGGSGEVSGSGSKSWTATVISTAGNASWSVTATDTRGRTATATGSISITAYSAPTIVINELYRSTSGGTASGDGTYYRIRATVTPVTSGLSGNTITQIRVQHRKKTTPVPAWSAAATLTNNAISTQGANTITTADGWEVRVSCRDNIRPTTDIYSGLGNLPPAVRSFDFRNDRAAFGKFVGDTAKRLYMPEDWDIIMGAESYVKSWAREASRPIYTAADVGALPITGGTFSTRGSTISWPEGTTGKQARIFTENDGTIVISLEGTTSSTGFAIGGSSGNLLYKTNRILDASNYTSYCTPANIGAAASSHSHSYLPLSGGTLTDTLQVAGGGLHHSMIGTGNKQLINANATTVYVGNPATQMTLESSNAPNVYRNSASFVNIDSGNYTSYAQKKITYGTSNPSGGSAGDIYIKY